MILTLLLIGTSLRAGTIGAREELVRQGSGLQRDLELLGKLGTNAEVQRLPNKKEMYQALIDDKIDVLISPTPLESVPDIGVRFTHAVRQSRLLWVGPATKDAPEKQDGCHFSRTSDLPPMLEELMPELQLQAHADAEDGGELLAQVADGKLPHACVLEDELDDYLAYGAGVKIWKVMRPLALAWIVRADNDALLAKINGALGTQKAPLDYKQRGALRVGMPNDASSYYLDRDQPAGLQYELASAFAKQLGVRLEVVVLPAQDVDLTVAGDGYESRSADLKKKANAFLQKEGAAIRKRYLAIPEEAPVTVSGKQLSPFDAIAQKLAKQYDQNWRAVVAQMFTESRYNPNAKSPVGALGLMQVMPKTGKGLGFTNLTDPEEGLHAGVKYMRELLTRYKGMQDEVQRMRFSLAAYNGGYAHLMDARRMAGSDEWPEVAKALLLLEQKEHYSKARYGYCRGREVVGYVTKVEAKLASFK